MVMQMDEGLDTGPVLMAEKVAHRPQDLRRSHGGAVASGRRSDGAGAGGAGARQGDGASPSAEGVTYAKKITKDEARIDWRKAPPRSIA